MKRKKKHFCERYLHCTQSMTSKGTLVDFNNLKVADIKKVC